MAGPHEVNVNPDRGLETLVDLRRPQMLGESGLTGVPSIILDPNEFRLERMLKRDHLLYGVATPFVGRREALEIAYNAVRDAVNERRLHSLGVVGISGVGKTRLLSEMFGIIDPLKRGIEVFSACCSESEPPDGLAIIAQFLRRRFQIAPRDSDEVAREKILDRIDKLVDSRHIGVAARQLGYLAGLRIERPGGSGPDAEKQALKLQRHAVSTWTNLLRYYAGEMPQIFVVHRCQHMTPRAVGVLESLMVALATTPCTLVFVGDAATPAPLIEASTAHSEIELGPLQNRDMDRLVRAVLRKVDTLPDGLVADIIARSAGNPRLAEDNIRLLIQRGAIEPDEGRWIFHASKLGAKVVLAATTEAASRARIAGLAPDVRHVLEMAAVFGPAFWRQGVLAMLRVRPPGGRRASVPWFHDEPAGWLDRVLESATREDLVEDQDRSALAGHRELSFTHREDRTTLLAELTPEDRALHHRLVAQWLSGLSAASSGAWTEIVAEHYDAGERGERAAVCFLSAAEEAHGRYEYGRAKVLYRRALALVDLDSIDILLPVLEGYAGAAMQTGEFAQARRIWSALLEASLIPSDRAMGARAWLGLGRAHRRTGENPGALRAFEHARAMFEDLDDALGIAAVLHEQAVVTWLTGAEGAYDEALRLFGRALDLRRQAGDRLAASECLVSIANVHLKRRRFTAAEEGFTEARAIRHSDGDRAGEAYCLVGLGAVRHALGNREGAIDAWRAGLELSERLGDRERITIFLNNLGEVFLETDSLAEAQASLERALELTEETGDQRSIVDVNRNLGAVHIARGDWDQAMASVDEAIDVARAAGLRPAMGQALRTRGEILSSRLYDASGTTTTEAESCFEEAIAIFEEAGDALELSRTLESLARHLFERGKAGEARKVKARADRLVGR